MARLVVSSTQYPYYGGAATNAYALIKYLRSNGHNVAGIFFENSNANVDPDKIGGVFKGSGSIGKDVRIKRAVESFIGGEPIAALCKNYAAPIYTKGLFKSAKMVYLVTGSPIMMELSKDGISANRYMRSGLKKVFPKEYQCISKSNVVIPNSVIAESMLRFSYGDDKKIHSPIDTSLAFNSSIKSSNICIKDRAYDIVFICSNFLRPVKNAALARKIFNSEKMSGTNNIVIGNNQSFFNGIKNVKALSLSSQSTVINYIKNSKVVICTSYYDASPNVIKEAIMCGTNILVSKNCGWSEAYSDESVCFDVYNIGEWVNKIEFLLSNSVPQSLMDKGHLNKKLSSVWS